MLRRSRSSRTLVLAAMLVAGRAGAAEPGDLYVQSDKEGLPVWVDGVATGQVTPVLLHGLAPGKHAVQALSGCDGASADVEVVGGRIARAELTIAPLRGTVHVVPTPDMPVTLSSTLLAATAATTVELPCGPAVLRVSADGWETADVQLTVPALGGIEVPVSLVRLRWGTLVVATTPLEAAVDVDGARVSTGPTTIDGLLAGAHEVRVQAVGYAPYRATVEVPVDGVLRLDVVLDSEVHQRTLGHGRPAPVPVSRWILNGTVAGLGLAAGGVAIWQHAEASAAYEDYLNVPDNDLADQIWADRVAPADTRALAAGVGAGVLLAGGIILFGTSVSW